MHTQDGYMVKELCAALEVSRSGFYAQGQKAQRGRRQQDARLAEQIGLIFVQSRQTYGCRRIQHQLRREGIRCGKSRICRLMNQGQLQAIQKRRFRVKTTQSRHELPVAPNRLRQRAQPPSRPNQVWSADITYLPTQEGTWLYLAAELDLCSRRIAGWKLDDSLATPLVVGAFERAVHTWSTAPELHHSDRGVQYATSSFRQVLQTHQVEPSMSRKACCYDNAAMESFFATLKTQCFQNRPPRDRAEAQAMLFDYIETFYNPQRLHSALGYLAPLEFENRLHQERKQKN
jgi:transposase InsO family protein